MVQDGLFHLLDDLLSQISCHLAAAINQLGAFLNDLASQEGRGNGRGPPEKITLPERRHRTAAMNAEGAIEQLALARAAQITE